MLLISFNALRRPFWVLLFSLAAACAWALPSPKDIDAAVNAGRLNQAETLLREVIQEKPNSAKAQYELGQVLARLDRFAEAQTALEKAKSLDPSLKFAASADKFNDILAKVSQQARAKTVTSSATLSEPSRAAVASTPAAPAPAPSFNWAYAGFGLVGLVLLALILRRPKPAPSYVGPASPVNASNVPPYGQGQPATAGYGPGQAPGYAPTYPGGPAAGGMASGIGGAVVGGLAGVAAGYALSKALEGDHHSSNASPTNTNDSGYVPVAQPSQPDLGSFDSGSGSGWDDGAEDDGSDDSW